MAVAPIRVLMFEAGGWGGIAHYTYNLCQALAAQDCPLTLVTGQPYELEPLPRDFQLEARFSPSDPYLSRARSVWSCLRDTRPDVFHLQSTLSARKDWLLLTLLRLLGHRIVFTAHNLMPHDAAERQAPGMARAFRCIYRLSNRIIVHGDSMKRELLSTFGVSPEKVAAIPLGQFTFVKGTDEGDPDAAKRQLGLPADQRLLLAFGAIREYKGIPDLIDAFAQVAADFPDVHLVVAGKPIGVDADTYRRQIQKSGIQERVTYRPEYVPFEQISTYFAACDVAVFPYRAIYQSAALQLAYGCSRPVIVTRVGELPETVRQGWNGLIVPPADPTALAEAIRELLDKPLDELGRMGERSLELAKDRHDWGEAAEKTMALYSELLPSA